MCMEDVRIGRETTGGQVATTVGTTSVQILSGSPHRYSIVLTPGIANHITFSTENPAVLGQGINLGPGDGCCKLNIQHHGDLVRKAWYAIADAGSNAIAVMVTNLAKE